jgi:enoyl-CoA hydratase
VAQMPLAAGLAYERQRFAALFGTADKTEGISARLDKRPARFD